MVKDGGFGLASIGADGDILVAISVLVVEDTPEEMGLVLLVVVVVPDGNVLVVVAVSVAIMDGVAAVLATIVGLYFT